MKKIFVLMAFASLGLTGCELDRLPETTLADTNFWKSENDFRGACNKLYVDLGGFWQDTRSDEIVSTSPIPYQPVTEQCQPLLLIGQIHIIK